MGETVNVHDLFNLDRVTRSLPPKVRFQLETWADHVSALMKIQNPKVLVGMGPSALRGLFMRRGKQGKPISLRAHHNTHMDFDYPSDDPMMRALYEKAKKLQWNGSTDLPWKTSVDPLDPEVPLLGREFVDWDRLKVHGFRFTDHEKRSFLWSVTSWMMSQFLHGEQGALLAAAQVTEATPIFDGKFYGATQVMDEARHVEVFHRYINTKLERPYQINDNLFTIIDGLMTDHRWDIKFLGMQILVEGLALGAFSTMYRMTEEPLLKELLHRVIQDEARHVRFGLLALRRRYMETLTERERREREDWAFEVVVLMRNRFLAHELFEEGFAHRMSRREWNNLMDQMPGMSLFRRTMFRRLVPNLRAIGLLTPRIMPHYVSLGLGEYFDLPASDTMNTVELVSA